MKLSKNIVKQMAVFVSGAIIGGGILFVTFEKIVSEDVSIDNYLYRMKIEQQVEAAYREQKPELALFASQKYEELLEWEFNTHYEKLIDDPETFEEIRRIRGAMSLQKFKQAVLGRVLNNVQIEKKAAKRFIELCKSMYPDCTMTQEKFSKSVSKAFQEYQMHNNER